MPAARLLEPRLLTRYLHGDSRRHRREARVLEPIPLERFLPALPRHSVGVSEDESALQPALGFFRALQPHVIVSAVPSGPPSGLQGVAALGIWQVYLDVDAGQPMIPEGVWPVLSRRPVTTIELRVLSETESADLTLSRLEAATDRFSVTRGRASCARSAARMLEAGLRQAQARHALPRPVAGGPTAKVPRVRLPSNLDVLAWEVTRFPLRVQQAYLDRWHTPEWQVALHVAPPPGGDPCFEPGAFRVIPSPPGTYRADPCVVLHEGRYYVFMEEYVHSLGRGHIAVMELDADGNPSQARPVLERPYHLSYPCVFSWRGEWFMVPESMEHGKVELYRATEFPDQWMLERVLLDGVRACDATIHEQDSHWWMLVTLAGPNTRATEELHLYHADTPLGPWSPVLANPVKQSVRGGRSAGRLFRMGGRWLRPGQDSTRSYGHFIRMFEVRQLSAERYEEAEVFQLGPVRARGIEGLHTFSHAGRVTAIDLLQMRPRWT